VNNELPENRKNKLIAKNKIITALRMIVTFIILLSFYIFAEYKYNNEMLMKIVFYTYYAAAVILFAAIVILNGGIGNEIPAADNLSDTLTPEQKEKYISHRKKCRNIAKKLMFWFIPLLITITADIIYIMVS